MLGLEKIPDMERRIAELEKELAEIKARVAVKHQPIYLTESHEKKILEEAES